MNNTFTQDGHDYSTVVSNSPADSVISVEVLDVNEEAVGTLEIDHNMDFISYQLEDGTDGTYNYYELTDQSPDLDTQIEILAKWLVAISY